LNSLFIEQKFFCLNHKQLAAIMNCTVFRDDNSRLFFPLQFLLVVSFSIFLFKTVKPFYVQMSKKINGLVDKYIHTARIAAVIKRKETLLIENCRLYNRAGTMLTLIGLSISRKDIVL
jgi:hypothetical protein